MRGRALFAAACLCLGAEASAAGVASLDYCADQFVIALAAPENIAALSPGADKEYSFMREAAKGLPRARPVAEEIIPLAPDVVVRSWGGDPRLVRLLEGAGARVVTLGYATDFDGVRANIETVSDALGEQEKGAALIAAMDAKLAALADNPARVSALYVTPGGVTAGAGTMIDAIIGAAGATNAATQAGLYGWPSLPAEALILDPPEAIVAGFFRRAEESANHWSAARHPALARLFAETPTVHLDADVLSCPGWFAADAAASIAAGFAPRGAP